MDAPPDPDDKTQRLLRCAAEGDQEGWSILLAQHRGRLRRMVALRLDQRLQGRIDPSDVIQEAFLEASVRLPEYLRQPSMSFFLWLRFLTGQKLVALHRHHLRTDMRDASREISLYHGALPETSSAALAGHLLGRELLPSEAAMRAEMKIRLQEALERHGPARPGSAGAAALRATEQPRNRPGAGHSGGDGQQTVRPGAAPP